MKKTFYAFLIGVAAVLYYNLGMTNSSGAPAGNTGAPGEGNCSGCHSGTFNSGAHAPQISIAGNPAAYVPGQTYAITVSFTNSSLVRHGFQLVALNSSNQNAGTLTAGAGTQLLPSGGKTYITHTLAGSASKTWTFNWTAPATAAGTVTFYASFNAANNNSTTTGDNIYTRSLALSVSTGPAISSSFGQPAAGICAGANFNVPFTASGTFNTGNIFTAQLSDHTGSFASPLNIGTLSGTSSGSIMATIPAGAANGSAYRIRVISTSPVITGTDNGTDLAIGHTADAAGAISGTADVCAGQPGVRYAVPAISGASSYLWTVPSGAAIVAGANTNTITVDFSHSAASGNITVQGISACGNGSVSAPLAITVNPAPARPAITQPEPDSLMSSVIGASYEWRVGTTVLTQTSRKIRITQSGSYTVRVRNASFCESEASPAFAVTVAGIRELANSQDLSVYPNPAQGTFFLKFANQQQGLRVEVYSLTGQKVYSKELRAAAGEERIDLSAQAKGVYVLKVQTAEGTAMKKMIIQ